MVTSAEKATECVLQAIGVLSRMTLLAVLQHPFGWPQRMSCDCYVANCQCGISGSHSVEMVTVEPEGWNHPLELKVRTTDGP